MYESNEQAVSEQIKLADELKHLQEKATQLQNQEVSIKLELQLVQGDKDKLAHRC